MKLAQPEATNTTAEETMDSSKANIGLINVELSRNERQKHWMSAPADPDEDVNHEFKIHQILVGTKSAKDEEQVIEAEFYSAERKTVTIPIAYLKRGHTNQVRLEVPFPAGTLFHLTEGNGPVHLLGSHVISTSPEDDLMPEDVEEEEEEDDEEENGDGNDIARDIDFEGKPVAGDQAACDENGSKKRKQPDRENGGESKKLKSAPPNANSDMDDEGDENGGDGAMD